ncbi:hypothetical protein GCM10020218_068380 [Dactylosporangium vinaceum]
MRCECAMDSGPHGLRGGARIAGRRNGCGAVHAAAAEVVGWRALWSTEPRIGLGMGDGRADWLEAWATKRGLA